MISCRMIYPYYDNPSMLRMQVDNWNRYAGDLRRHVKVILIDDGSPNYPAIDYVKDCKIPLSLFRINENIPWNQHGARNLGAKVAGDEDAWLFFSDMDIMLTAEAAFTLFDRKFSPARYYTMERTYAPDFKDRKYHCNSFVVSRAAFWQVGGYDEDYCGTYGGDGPFLRQLEVIAPRKHLDDVMLIGYERVVKDANTKEWDRTGPFKEAYRKKFEEKRRSGDERAKNPLRFTWSRQL